MKSERLVNFPVSFFSVVMGLTGTAIALSKAEAALASSFKISWFILGISLLSFILISFFYMLKLIIHRSAVAAEFNNPVRLSFFPAISIGLILLSIGFSDISAPFSSVLAALGATLQLILSLAIISEWIKQDRFEIKHMNPSWFIPAVGNILVPISGVFFFPVFINWFFFSIGFSFWVILFVIFFYRIVFHHPMPDKLLPTLFILIAPPAVGFISYFRLTGHIDVFSYALISIAIFMFLLLLSMGKMFFRIRFYLSWWAYSFPVAALTIASFLMFTHEKIIAFKYISFALLAGLSLLILYLGFRTLLAISRNEICVEE